MTRRFAEAGRAFEDAVAALKALADQHPAILKYARGLACMRVFRADFLRGTGKVEDSVAGYTEAVADLEAAAGEARGEETVRSILRDAYAGRAKAFDRLERFDEALADWDRALESETGPLVASLRLLRAGTLVRRGDHGRATAEADAVVQGDRVSPNNLYNATVIFSLTGAAVADDSPLKEGYAVRSVGLLRRAVGKGFPPDVNRFKTKPYFKAVQRREDFRQLLREMGERQKPSQDGPAPDQ